MLDRLRSALDLRTREADFRSWTDVPAHEPKVCYEPADPSNHLLVDGRIRCGMDAGP